MTNATINQNAQPTQANDAQPKNANIPFTTVNTLDHEPDAYETAQGHQGRFPIGVPPLFAVVVGLVALLASGTFGAIFYTKYMGDLIRDTLHLNPLWIGGAILAIGFLILQTGAHFTREIMEPVIVETPEGYEEVYAGDDESNRKLLKIASAVIFVIETAVVFLLQSEAGTLDGTWQQAAQMILLASMVSLVNLVCGVITARVGIAAKKQMEFKQSTVNSPAKKAAEEAKYQRRLAAKVKKMGIMNGAGSGRAS